jgi:protein-S-isoprenylcysteine O-methyltransferase Ste14
MDLNLKLVIGFSCFYGMFELFMSTLQRKTRGKRILSEGDRGSLWVLLTLIMLGYFLAFYLSFMGFGRVHNRNLMFAAGAILALSGLAVRLISILTLKQQFTYKVTQIESHALVDHGVYKYIRHPGYLGQILIFTGTAMAQSSWVSVLCMIFPVLLGFSIRIRIEERFLLEHLGSEYAAYRHRTRKLIPGVY